MIALVNSMLAQAPAPKGGAPAEHSMTTVWVAIMAIIAIVGLVWYALKRPKPPDS